MARRLFVLPSVGAGDKVLIASNTGGTPAEIVPNGSGGPVTGSILQAAGDGSLPRVLGPNDGTSTLYLLRLNYRGTITGSPTTLTGVDPGAATVLATSPDVAAAVAALVNGAPADRDTLGEIAAILSSLSSGGSSLTPTAVKTANYTAAAGDFVPVDTTSGSKTITLPTAPADKTQVGIKHVIQGGTNAVTVACAGSDVLNKTGGATSFTLPLLAQAVILQYKASAGIWYVLEDDLPLSQLDGRFAPLTEGVNAVSPSGAAQTIPDPSVAGNPSLSRYVLNNNCVFTLPTPGFGKAFSVMLVQDATGGRVPSFTGATVKWAGGTSPTYSTVAGKVDIVSFTCFDGSNYVGVLGGLDFR